MEKAGEFRGPKVEQRGRVAGDAVIRCVVGINAPVGSQTNATVANAQRNAIGGVEFRVVTGGTGYCLIARQDRIEEQQLPQLDLWRVDVRKCDVKSWKPLAQRWPCDQQGRAD